MKLPVLLLTFNTAVPYSHALGTNLKGCFSAVATYSLMTLLQGVRTPNKLLKAYKPREQPGLKAINDSRGNDESLCFIIGVDIVVAIVAFHVLEAFLFDETN